MTPRRNFNELLEKTEATPEGREAVQRARMEAVQEIVAFGLQELRRLRRVTQVEVAAVLGAGQPTVSKLENSDDLRLSALRSYVEAIGGRLEVAAVFDEERIPLAL